MAASGVARCCSSLATLRAAAGSRTTPISSGTAPGCGAGSETGAWPGRREDPSGRVLILVRFHGGPVFEDRAEGVRQLGLGLARRKVELYEHMLADEMARERGGTPVDQLRDLLAKARTRLAEF
jgi:hypothetical protein